MIQYPDPVDFAEPELFALKTALTLATSGTSHPVSELVSESTLRLFKSSAACVGADTVGIKEMDSVEGERKTNAL